MIPVLVAIACALILFGIVLYPILQPGHSATLKESNFIFAQGKEQEQVTKTLLQELELDYQLGNLDQPDYEVLRNTYTARAIAILKERDEQDKILDDLIEQQVNEMRGALRELDSEKRTAKASRGTSPAKISPHKCRNCGRDLQEGDQFCSGCGHKVKSEQHPHPAKSSKKAVEAKRGKK